MTLFGRRCLVRWLAGGCSALLAGLLLAPSAARAECGDYVVMGGAGARSNSAAMPPVHRQPATPGDHHAPCSGPNCSRRSPPAVPAPVAPSPDQSEDWGCPIPLESFPGPAGQHRAAPEESLHPVAFVLAIYHPPRFATSNS